MTAPDIVWTVARQRARKGPPRGKMHSNKFRLLAATSILAALAIPVGLHAQVNGDAQITILQTTDLHDHANGADHVGLDVDSTMGTLYDLTLASRPLALSFLDLMRYDCVTLGNHEWDYTPKGLAQMLGAAQSSFEFHTPIVASNMNAARSPELAPFVGDGRTIQATRVQQLSNGLKVGYIGLMGRGAAT